MYHVADDRGNSLGFSLKPPKWLRKMQPGNLLKKAAVPLGIIGASLLIPGVGSALAAGAMGVARGGASIAKFGARRGMPIVRGVQKVQQPISLATSLVPLTPSSPPITAVTGASVTPQVMTPAIPASPGGAIMAPTGGGGYGGGSIPVDTGEPVVTASSGGNFPMLPLLIGGALLLFMSKKRN